MLLPDRVVSAEREALVGDIVALLPQLRAFAISLCRDPVRADDLVQDAVARALANLDSFQPGTNLEAWVLTILRNNYRSEYRKRKREVEDAHGLLCGHAIEKGAPAPSWYKLLGVGSEGDAIARLDWGLVSHLIETHLPPDQRDALIAVAVDGMGYEEAAEVLGSATGTIKSRVNRARQRIAELVAEYAPVEEPETAEEALAWQRIEAAGTLDDGWEGTR